MKSVPSAKNLHSLSVLFLVFFNLGLQFSPLSTFLKILGLNLILLLLLLKTPLKLKQFVQKFLLCLVFIAPFYFIYSHYSVHSWKIALLPFFNSTLVSLAAHPGLNWNQFNSFLMSRKRLSPFLGYPLTKSLNSLDHIRLNYRRMAHLKKMRQIPQHHVLLLFIPLLVSLVRYSEQMALGLMVRSLNRQKSYFWYEMYQPTLVDGLPLMGAVLFLCLSYWF